MMRHVVGFVDATANFDSSPREDGISFGLLRAVAKWYESGD